MHSKHLRVAWNGCSCTTRQCTRKRKSGRGLANACGCAALQLNASIVCPVCVQVVLDEWMHCQQSWLYLQPIFGSEDIMQQMPNEGRKFKAVDTAWRRVMERLSKQAEVGA